MPQLNKALDKWDLSRFLPKMNTTKFGLLGIYFDICNDSTILVSFKQIYDLFLLLQTLEISED